MTLTLVSGSNSATTGNAISSIVASFSGATLSADGRYVVYSSTASNLAAGDTNSQRDIFVFDRVAGTNTLVSTNSSGTLGDGFSNESSISADGRYVVFGSSATNLVTGDTNLGADIFIKDRQTGTTIRVAPTGVQPNAVGLISNSSSVSSDGRYIAFTSNANNLVSGDTNGLTDLFVFDAVLGTVVRANLSSAGAQQNFGATNASISGNGRYAVFASLATGLTPDATNGQQHIYRRDLQTNTTSLVSASSAGVQASAASFVSSISNDGRFVVFNTGSTNLVDNDTNGVGDIFIRDMVTGVTRRVLTPTGGQTSVSLSDPFISGDGRFVTFVANDAYSGGSSGFNRVYVASILTGEVATISTFTGGTDASSTTPALSADGRWIAFATTAIPAGVTDANGANDIYLSDNPLAAALKTSGAMISGTAGQFEGYDTIWTDASTPNAMVTLQLLDSGAAQTLDLADELASGGLRAATIAGSADNDTITTAGGADYLNGGAGADAMNGGDGDDVYFVDNVGDTATDSSGFDVLWATGVDYTIAEGLDNIALDGAGDNNATGNSTANGVRGNDGNNILRGMGGNDQIFGYGGNDTLIGGAGIDTLFGGLGNDTFVLAASASDWDAVCDFVSGTDLLGVSTAAYGYTSLTAALFESTANGRATNGSSRFIFNTSTNELTFDADGNGSGGAVRIAYVFGATSLGLSDFTVVA